MEFGSEDLEGPNIRVFLWSIIRDVDKGHFNLSFRNAQIAKASSQVPHDWKYRSREYVLLTVGAQPPKFWPEA